MLKLYRLKPKVGTRKLLSAASVKENLYNAAQGEKVNWQKDVPEKVAEIIKENWKIVEQYSQSEDKTTRVAGMKFPKEGWSS